MAVSVIAFDGHVVFWQTGYKRVPWEKRQHAKYIFVRF